MITLSVVVGSTAMPGRPPYEHEVVQKWTAQIGATDGFVFVTREYNYGPSAVLKNAIDWVCPEWNRKAAAFVSYGSAMGARAVQQHRETAIEMIDNLTWWTTALKAARER